MGKELLDLGWIRRGDYLVRFSNPRIGWKEDGTLVVGYHQWPEKVTTMERLLEILQDL